MLPSPFYSQTTEPDCVIQCETSGQLVAQNEQCNEDRQWVRVPSQAILLDWLGLRAGSLWNKCNHSLTCSISSSVDVLVRLSPSSVHVGENASSGPEAGDHELLCQPAKIFFFIPCRTKVWNVVKFQKTSFQRSLIVLCVNFIVGSEQLQFLLHDQILSSTIKFKPKPHVKFELMLVAIYWIHFTSSMCRYKFIYFCF